MTSQFSPIRRLTGAFALAAMVASGGCAQKAQQAAAPASAQLSRITIGQSSRTDVFAALGRPTRTERSGAGETWVYETQPADDGHARLVNSASAASGIAGAFVPFAGLVGSGLGLAQATGAGGGTPAESSQTSIRFGEDGIVRDCVYASTAMPEGVAGAAAASGGCQKLRPVSRPVF